MKKIIDRRKVANEFNDYFNSIALKLNDSIISTSIFCAVPHSFEEFVISPNESSIFLNNCLESEVLKIISQFDNNYKCSDIPIPVINKSGHMICPVLAKYFNLFMAEGTFPDVFKVGKVTPIQKMGAPKMLVTIRLSQPCQYLVRSLKRLSINKSTTLLFHKALLMKINLALGNHIQLVML